MMMWSWAPWWHWVGMAAFWLLIVVTALWVAGRLFPETRHGEGVARSILDERLARGEIDPAQYRALQDELERR